MVKVSDCSSSELGSIVRNDDIEKSKSAHDLLSIKMMNSLGCDFGDSFRLYTLCEIINSYNKKTLVTQIPREQA